MTQKIIIDDKFRKQALRNLKGIELEKNGEVDRAIELYEKNIEEGFDGSHSFDRLAIIYRKKGLENDEIKVLQKAISVFEDKIKVYEVENNPLEPIESKKLEKFKERLKKIQTDH
jgi:tetratricopeptide (TPR) repeat protein